MLGILIVNTGTAAAPTEEAVRAHLREFLQDRHLINVPPLIWRPILELFILPKRPRRTLDRYIDFWTPEGSPFMLESQAQRDEIARRLAHLIDEPHEVRLAMRYGQPSIRGAIEAFLDACVDRIIVLPMYPQKTIPCAGSVLDEFDAQFAALTKARSLSADAAPEVLRIDEYWREPGYLDALAGSIRRCWAYRPGSKLVMSYHSIPVSYVTKGGDTYPDAAAETLRRTAEILGVPEEDQVIAFQSRFDSRRWVGPMLVPTVRRLAAEGVRDIAVASPIFSVDCLETYHDIRFEAKAAYLDAAATAGISDPSFTYVPALGADAAFMDAIARLIARRAARS